MTDLTTPEGIRATLEGFRWWSRCGYKIRDGFYFGDLAPGSGVVIGSGRYIRLLLYFNTYQSGITEVDQLREPVQGGPSPAALSRPRRLQGAFDDLLEHLAVRVGVVGGGEADEVLAAGEAGGDLPHLPLLEGVGVGHGLGHRGGPGVRHRFALGVGDEVPAPPVAGWFRLGFGGDRGHVDGGHPPNLSASSASMAMRSSGPS